MIIILIYWNTFHAHNLYNKYVISCNLNNCNNSLSLSHTHTHTRIVSLCCHVCRFAPLFFRLSLDARHMGGRSSAWVSVQGTFLLLLCSRNARLAQVSGNQLQRRRRIILGRHIVHWRVQVCHKSREDSISNGPFRTVPTYVGYRIKIIIRNIMWSSPQCRCGGTYG